MCWQWSQNSTTPPNSGVRQFSINGSPIVVRGGGWSPDLFIRYDPADTARQIGVMKAMGVNTIRLEGHFMPADWYQQMDAAGILVNAGYQCCDFWEATSYSAADNAVYQQTATSFGQMLRNHPSVFSFQWSDNAPTANQASREQQIAVAEKVLATQGWGAWPSCSSSLGLSSGSTPRSAPTA